MFLFPVSLALEFIFYFLVYDFWNQDYKLAPSLIVLIIPGKIKAGWRTRYSLDIGLIWDMFQLEFKILF